MGRPQDPAPRHALRRLAFTAIVSLIAGACAGGSLAPSPTTAPRSPSKPAEIATPQADLVVGGDRPVTVHIPASYDAHQPAPLLILLHGFTSSGEDRDVLEPGSRGRSTRFRLRLSRWDVGQGRQPVLERHRCLLQFLWGRRRRRGLPHGRHRRDPGGACHRPEADRFRRALQRRLHVVSDGLRTGRPVAAIVSLAGATYADPTDCAPSEPVPSSQIHGRPTTPFSMKVARSQSPTPVQKRRPRHGRHTTGATGHRPR